MASEFRADAPASPDGDLFDSTASLRAAFAEGLGRMLRDAEGLGPFILVLANATFDPGLREALGGALGRRFTELAEHCREALTAGRPLREPEDDLAVFLRLMAIGFDAVQDARLREAGPWEIQFNQVRSLRPARAAGSRPASLRVPFDAAGFHFNKPFLRREALWHGSLDGVESELLFNKFPFVPFHGLLVPERERCQPQYLDEAVHHWLWRLTRRLGDRLPGVGFGYNSLGAYASINHLHFQMFVRERPLPVAGVHWLHNGGAEPYPVACARFADPASAWARIDAMQRAGTCCNLVYLPGALYCLPRLRQGDYALPAWCGGQAWYEMSGGVVAFNADDFAALSPADVRAALALTAVGGSGG